MIKKQIPRKNIIYALLIMAMITMVAIMLFNEFSMKQPRPITRTPQVSASNNNVVHSFSEAVNKSEAKHKADEIQSSLSEHREPYKFHVDQKTLDLLEMQESLYVSQVNKKATDAKIDELESQQKLQALKSEPTSQIEQPKKAKQPSIPNLIDVISVKGIINDSSQNIAWLDVDGRYVPVEIGANVGELRVTNIQRNFVRFVNRKGVESTKYIELTVPKKIGDNDERQ